MLVEEAAERIIPTLTLDSQDEDALDFVETFWHEWVHHIQALSCAQIRIEGLQMIQMAAGLVFSKDEETQRNSAMQLALLDRRFEHRAFGVSMRDLCEGVAVLESYRIHYVEPNAEGFLSWRDIAFPGKGNSPYRRTFDILANETNAEIAFDLLPVLTFLALQGDVPGASFDTLLVDERVRSAQLVGQPARRIVTDLGYSVLPDQFSRVTELHPSQRHKTLYPVLAKLVGTLGPDEALEIFARPHTVMDWQKPSRGIDGALMPPLIVGAHRPDSGAYVAFGAARESKDLRIGILLLTAMLSAAESIVSPREKRVPCPHQKCPNHASSICHGYFTPPSDSNNCGFRNEIRSVTGCELHEILEVVRSLSLEDDLKRIRECEETSELFPEIEFDRGAERESCAERFDERYMLDPEDNDPVTLVICKTAGCNTIIQVRISKRQTRRGLDISCPNCGHKCRIDHTKMPTYHYP
jgi:hypothetical protein